MRALRFIPVLLALASAAPAHAWVPPQDATPIRWEALPCAVACAHWGDLAGIIPGRRDPLETACEAPFPPGSYADVITLPAPTPAPGKTMLLAATLRQNLNWDLFMCEAEPPNRFVSAGSEPGQEYCTIVGPNWPVPLGCQEYLVGHVEVGEQRILRAYNWADLSAANGFYWFTALPTGAP